MLTEESFKLLAFIWIGSVATTGFKMLFDQLTLLKSYRKEINPPYAILPFEIPGVDFPYPHSKKEIDQNFTKTSLIQLKIPFSKHPTSPNIAKLAKRVRFDLLLSLIIAVGGFTLMSLLVLLKLQ